MGHIARDGTVGYPRPMMGGGQVWLMVRAGLVGLLGCALLAACSSRPYDPADVPAVYEVRNSPIPVPDPQWNPRRGGKPTQMAAKAAPPAATGGGRSITVSKGDTLYGLSRAHGVPVRDLIAANGIKPPYTLSVGQSLTLPANQTHTVKKGETGYGISRQYGVTVSALMEANNIRPPYALSVGQKLVLPGGARGGPSDSTAVASAPTPMPSANKPKVTTKPGRTVAMPKPPPRSGTGFAWPLDGKLAARFGPKAGGLHNDGINILAKTGTPVRAAEAGVVVYASNALEGYGNLLLIRHDGGWVTAYAHNERLLVRPGQKVDKGMVIARVGATGGVTSPQLHFEIRKGRQALDPLRYLSTQQANAG